MAFPFPTTAVLDTFTRADENPVAGGWAGPLVATTNQMKVVSNALKSTTTGIGSSYWNTATFGPAVEVYVTIPTWWANDSGDFALWLHTNAENTAGLDGYQLYIWQASGVFHWQIYRYDNNAATFLGGVDVGSQVISNGDSIGLSITADGILQAWYKAAAGAWTTEGSTRTDTIYTTGHIGIQKGFNDTTTVFDDFGGGNRIPLTDTVAVGLTDRAFLGVRAAGTVESLRTGTSDPMTWSHNVGTSQPRGVAVCFIHGTTSTDHVSSVTYGGTAMTRVQRNVDTATEPGAAEWWVLLDGMGVAIPTGTQTVSADLASATTDDILGVSVTLDADYPLHLIDVDGITDGSSANPSVTLNYQGINCMAFGALYSGITSGVTAGTNCTLLSTSDLAGNFTAATVRQILSGTTDFAIATVAGADDTAYAAIAIGQTPPWPDTLLIGLTESALSVVATNLDVTEVSDSDTCPVQLVETASLTSTFTFTDSCKVQVTEAPAITATHTSTDTIVVQLTDTAVVQNSFSVTGDTCIVQLAEVSALVVVITSTDTIVVQLTDGVLTVTASLVTSDTCAVRLTETSSFSNSTAAQDTCIIQLTDTVALLVSFSAAGDTCIVQLTETTSFSNSAFAVDSCAVQVSERPSMLVSFSPTGETCIVQLVEGLLSVDEGTGLISVPVSDSCAIQLSEGALAVPTTEQRTADSARVGLTETAHVAVFENTEDTVSPAVLEAQAFVSAVVSLSESLGCTLSEAADLFCLFSTSGETSVVGCMEGGGTVAIPFSTSDSCLVGCMEGTGSIDARIPRTPGLGRPRLPQKYSYQARAGRLGIHEKLNW